GGLFRGGWAAGRGPAGGAGPSSAGARDPAPARCLPRGLAYRHGGLLGDLVLGGGLVGQDVALVDPDLHADASERGTGLGLAVVDVGPQGVQRHPALAVPLLAAHLGAAEPAAALHADPLRARLHRGLHGALHRPAERHPPGQLVRDTLGDQRGVELGLLDLLNVEVNPRVARDLQQAGAQPVGLGTAPTDDDAGPGRVHVDPQLVARALDLDATDR